MAQFDVKDLDINSKLPEWWKHDTFLVPLNMYTQQLIIDLVHDLLNNLGVVQPFNVWKWLPEEYNWTHNYFSSDEYLEGKDCILRKDIPINALVPNTKRDCNAIITLELQGNNKTTLDDNGNFDKQHQENINITISNANQILKINNVSNLSTIKIFTETNDILIDGVSNTDLIEGRIDKIKPIPKNPDFHTTDIDGNKQHIDIKDENKITKIKLESDKEVNFNLNIELIKPIYVTEQHIRLSTVSAFPLEWIRLYGFFCHEFNDKEGYQLLWEKQYKTDDRIVYDKITKQYDCEKFYIQVKLYGIGMPIKYGFPQEELASDPTYALNRNLDKWGRIYGLPRRVYRNDISKEEEQNTFPQYYDYPIEQDYWYEERLVNEYRYNEDATSGLFIKDSDLNNVALLESISPHINDVWVFTETIAPETDINRETGELYPCQITTINDEGVAWPSPQSLKKETYISEPFTLEPKDNQAINDYSYKTKSIKLRYNLRDINIPKNIEITGIQLKFHAETDLHSNSLKLDPHRSKMLLNTIYRTDGGNVFSKQEAIDIAVDIETWKKGQKRYKLGGKDYLFGLDSINREQLFRKFDDEGNYIETGYLDFIIAFQNDNDSLSATMLLHSVTLEIFYKLYQDEFKIDMKLSSREIVTSKGENSVNLVIDVENTGMTEIENKKIFIAVPPELKILDDKDNFDFNLDIGESFTIGDGKAVNQNGELYNDPQDIITIESVDNRTGIYDIILFCDDKVIRDEITVRQGFIIPIVSEDLTKYYKDPNKQFVVTTLHLTGETYIPTSTEYVTFNINQTDYQRQINSNGRAQLSIINLKPGEYPITTTWLGKTIKNTITILSKIVSQDLNIKQGDNSYFTVTLLDYNGHPVDANTEVIFGIKGQTYTAITNSQGKASLDISNLEVGRYVVSTKYDGETKQNVIIIT